MGGGILGAVASGILLVSLSFNPLQVSPKPSRKSIRHSFSHHPGTAREKSILEVANYGQAGGMDCSLSPLVYPEPIMEIPFPFAVIGLEMDIYPSPG